MYVHDLVHTGPDPMSGANHVVKSIHPSSMTSEVNNFMGYMIVHRKRLVSGPHLNLALLQSVFERVGGLCGV